MTEQDLEALISRAKAYGCYVRRDLDAAGAAALTARVDEAVRMGRALVIARLRGERWKVLMRRYDLGRTVLYVRWRAASDELADELETLENLFTEHQPAGSPAEVLLH